MRAAGLEPLEPYPGSTRPWRCKCERCDREVTPRFGSIKQGQGGCKYCSSKVVDPEAAASTMRAAGLEPLEPYEKAVAPWLCRCLTCGREVRPRFSHVQDGHAGCGYCAGKAVDPETAASLMKAAGFEPLVEFTSVKTPWRCRCMTCGREVTPRFNNVRQTNSGCAFCTGQKIEAEDAVSDMKAAGVTPLEDYPGTKTPWRCRCDTCGRDVTPTYGGVRHAGHSACAFCAGKRVDPIEAAALMRSARLEPLEPYPGANVPWRCTCLGCGEEVRPHYSNIQQGHSGCRTCADSGFNPIAPAVVYLLTHEELDAIKIGITGAQIPTDRIAQHARHGWKPVGTWDVSYGRRAEEIETEILHWWREELGAPQAVEAEAMRQGGATETAPLAKVSLTETANRVRRLVAET